MVLLFLANGFEEIEALTPVDILRRAGVEVVTVGIGARQIRGAHGILVEADTDDSHLPCELPEMVILPGGMPGATNLDLSPIVEQTLARVAEHGGYLAAICAAPLVLGRRGYLRGKRATCYPGFEKELLGATVISEPCAVRDSNVITATGMGVALEFSLELLTALRDENTAKELKGKLMTAEK